MIAVCIKWIGASETSGMSAADEAAIEIALRHAEATRGSLIAVSVGGPASDHCLRHALSCGVSTAIRVNAPDDMDSASGRRGAGPGRRPQHRRLVRRLLRRSRLGQRSGVPRRAAASPASPRFDQR